MALEVDRATHDRRTDTYDSVADALESLEGVADAEVDDYHPRTAESAQIYVEVEHGDPILGGKRTAWPLDPDLRSLSPRLRNALDEADVSAWRLTSKPESLGDGKHDQAFYMVEVWA